MGLDRIMTPPSSSASTMPVAWMLPTTTTTTTTASDYAKSSASSAAPTSTTTASSRIPAQDIILSTLHQLLDPALQPPPPQPHHQLPRRPATRASPSSSSANDVVDITNRSSRSTRSTGTRTKPPPSSSSASSGRAVQHHQRQESSAGVSANSQRGAPPPTAISFPGFVNAAGPAASAPGLSALVQDLSSSLPHLLQVAAFSGISPQALLASLVTAMPAGVDPATLQLQSQPQPQRQGAAAMGSSSGSTTTTAAAATKAPAPTPHIPDPTYPRAVTTAHKLPLPKAHSGGGGLSFTPSVTSAFTSLKRPGEVARSSPPRSPNPPPLSSAAAARATTAGKPTPTSSVPLPALAVPGFPGLPPPDYAATLAALAASQQPPMAAPAGAAATTDYQARMQQYMQFLLLLQQQQPPQQQQLPPGFAVAPLPYITTPLGSIITAPAQSSLSSSAASTTSTSGKRARTSVKQESGGTKRSRGSRDDCPVTGRTSSNAGPAPTGDASDTAASRKRTRLDDQYGQLTDLGPPPRTAGGATRDGSAQPTPRRRAEASFGDGDDDDDDAVKRKRINQSQLDVLEAAYLDDPLPSRRTKQRLSTQLGISIKRVQIWFQNRRAKQKRQRKDGSDSGGDTFPEDGSDDPPSGGLFGLMD
ncbi:homeobox domain containing protein [Acanthamoeba castellanii str. Neff]|uniref:Homeobox domain containing protein n=1 Tax=Acanthamoeba castellanii (strain ATCC 30010 / Neff) TaxID=1257118 RepID=L8H3F0_ACACF|nr:homeobox domain containing protein [Acanthamoeba castellanii str. Neff]ELR19243.1 homeobox domain containing protein [Acanthamoeba castellanii str. Neff]